MAGEPGQCALLYIYTLAKTDILNFSVLHVIKAVLLNSAGTQKWVLSRWRSRDWHFWGDVMADKPGSLFHLELASHGD